MMYILYQKEKETDSKQVTDFFSNFRNVQKKIGIVNVLEHVGKKCQTSILAGFTEFGTFFSSKFAKG